MAPSRTISPKSNPTRRRHPSPRRPRPLRRRPLLPPPQFAPSSLPSPGRPPNLNQTMASWPACSPARACSGARGSVELTGTCHAHGQQEEWMGSRSSTLAVPAPCSAPSPASSSRFGYLSMMKTTLHEVGTAILFYCELLVDKLA